MNTRDEWEAFLRRFAGTNEWPGRPAATEEELEKTEAKLKVPLPPSYRAFLLASNGWGKGSFEMGQLRAANAIGWFRKLHPQWLSAYVETNAGLDVPPIRDSDYFDYERVDSIHIDVSHLKQTLCISEGGDDAVLLLNPMVVWPEGEWEVWLFSNSLPGAQRFRSFADWMQHELARKVAEPFHHDGKEDELPVVYSDPPTKPNRRIRLPETVPVLEDALKLYSSKSTPKRKKGIRQLGKVRSRAALEALLHTLKSDPDPQLRCEAAEALGQQQSEDGLEALAAAVDDPGVNSTAVAAIGRIKGEKAAQLLLSIVEAGGEYSGVAAYQLAARREHRVIPVLARFMESNHPDDRHLGGLAGCVVSEFGDAAAYAALEHAALSSELRVRERAIQGVAYLVDKAQEKTVKQKAGELLKRCFEAETDEQTRDWIGGWMKVTTVAK
jgi:HEAT repeat protein